MNKKWGEGGIGSANYLYQDASWATPPPRFSLCPVPISDINCLPEVQSQSHLRFLPRMQSSSSEGRDDDISCVPIELGRSSGSSLYLHRAGDRNVLDRT